MTDLPGSTVEVYLPNLKDSFVPQSSSTFQIGVCLELAEIVDLDWQLWAKVLKSKVCYWKV